mgnify:FL=1
MALTKIKLGKLISVVDERNTYDIKDFYGININKEFIPTVADTEGLNESNYKVVRKNRFVFSGMQTGRDECIRISIYLEEKPIIVSPAYTTFEIKDTDVVLPTYFFMLFLSKERDRLGWFYSDSSIRSNLDWVRFCDIEIELPDLAVQQKYVDIYNAMVANQQSYERGLDDLKLVCDGYIEDLRRQMPCEKIGPYIYEENNRNKDLQITNVQGVNSSSAFDETRADTNGLDFSNYKIVKNNQFAYNPSRISLGSISLYKNDTDCIISPMYCVFSVKKKELLPEYLMLWFGRKEFQRSTLFNAMGSVRDTFDFSLMKGVEIPIPDISIQQSIVDIYHVYMTRKSINEKLKAQIKNICPILIRGSLEESK